MAPADQTTIEVLFGHTVLKPPEYWVVGGEVAKAHWWSRRRSEYFVVCDTGVSIGPFDDEGKALTMCAFFKLDNPSQAATDAVFRNVYG
jgi:hypothetical protein